MAFRFFGFVNGFVVYARMLNEWKKMVKPGTHEAFVFKDKKLQELFLQAVEVRQIWLANANEDCAGVLAIHLWGKPASAGKLFSDTLEGLAAVKMRTVSDRVGCNPRWMADVDAGTHASRADKAVVDGGGNMRRRHWMYCYQLVLEAVSRACDLGRMACRTAAETGTHNITETVMLKPRVVAVSSKQIQLEAERCPTLRSAKDKTAAASAIVQRLCPSGLTIIQSEDHKDGSVSVAVVLDSRLAARTFIVNLAALRADEKPAKKAAPAPAKKVAAKKDESSDEDSDESEDEKQDAAKSHATKCVAAADLRHGAEAHGDAVADYESSDGDDVPLADKAPTSGGLFGGRRRDETQVLDKANQKANKAVPAPAKKADTEPKKACHEICLAKATVEAGGGGGGDRDRERKSGVGGGGGGGGGSDKYDWVVEGESCEVERDGEYWQAKILSVTVKNQSSSGSERPFPCFPCPAHLLSSVLEALLHERDPSSCITKPYALKARP
jgi:hypothetical protein